MTGRRPIRGIVGVLDEETALVLPHRRGPRGIGPHRSRPRAARARFLGARARRPAAVHTFADHARRDRRRGAADPQPCGPDARARRWRSRRASPCSRHGRAGRTGSLLWPFCDHALSIPYAPYGLALLALGVVGIARRRAHRHARHRQRRLTARRPPINDSGRRARVERDGPRSRNCGGRYSPEPFPPSSAGRSRSASSSAKPSAEPPEPISSRSDRSGSIPPPKPVSDSPSARPSSAARSS